MSNFNEFIVETRDPAKNHDFCCGCIRIPLSIPTTIIGLLGFLKLIVLLIHQNFFGKQIKEIITY